MQKYVGNKEEYRENMKDVENKKEYGEIWGIYEEICGKYEGILPTLQTMTKKNSEIPLDKGFGTWKHPEPSLPTYAAQ